mgnify:CR=1 FL=1
MINFSIIWAIVKQRKTWGPKCNFRKLFHAIFMQRREKHSAAKFHKLVKLSAEDFKPNPSKHYPTLIVYQPKFTWLHKLSTLSNNYLSLVIPTEIIQSRKQGKKQQKFLTFAQNIKPEHSIKHAKKPRPQSNQNIRHLYKDFQGNIIQSMKMLAAIQTCCHFTFAPKLQIQTHALIKLS